MPGTAPGDLVEAALSPRGRLLEGRLLRVLEPGLAPVATRCVHIEVCGGCQWQQVGIEAQREAKRTNLTEALVRIAKLALESLPPIALVVSPDDFGYRRRARFTVGEQGQLGYAGSDGRPAFALRECHLLDPALERLALRLSALFRKVAVRPSHVELCAAGGKAAVLLEFEGRSSTKPETIGELIRVSLPAVSGVVIRDDSRSVDIGEPALPEGDTLLHPDAFSQANGSVNALLVEAVLQGLDPGPNDRVLELFAGSGNFTIPLARRAREVIAVERAGVSLTLLEGAAAKTGLTNVKVIAGDAGAVVRGLIGKGERFDLALLDPPRTGAKEVIDGVARLSPRCLAYVSCEPATLARDLQSLGAQGYRLEAATVFDQFPQTYHLEALALLGRAD